MAKKSVILRQEKRVRLVARHAEKRAALLKTLRDPTVSIEDKTAARTLLHKLPRDSSPVRLHNRCALTGRPRGFHRKFGVSRLVLRRLAHRGELPGVRKASW